MTGAPDLGWQRLVWETRGYLGLDEDAPVPLAELRAQARAHGYDDREIDTALRATDALQHVDGNLETAQVVLADENPAVTEEITEGEPGKQTSNSSASAFEDAIEFFHAQLERDISDAAPEDIEMVRDYFTDVRGWDAKTIEDKRLGYAPASQTALLDHLMAQGYNRKTILGTGLFYEDLTPHFRGRYIFPYLNAEGRPVYAISRTVGDDGHPRDPKGGQKYTKAVKSKDYSCVEEPIYGLDSIREGDPVLITEGIADAITAHEAGYPCISPVTTQFKHGDRERLLADLRDRDVPRVFVVQDSERPTTALNDDADGWDALNVEQFGSGVTGAAATAGYLADSEVDARIAKLPRLGLDKVDLDDYLKGWSETLTPVLASADRPDDHPAYNSREAAINAATREQNAARRRAGSKGSALFDLDLADVAPVSTGYRGKSPLGHHGNSENYFVVFNDGYLGYDHKHKTAYNALTFLLCDAGERRASNSSGPLDDRETFVAWRHAKQNRHLTDDDPIPHNALQYVALTHSHCTTEDIEEGWKLPREAYNAAIQTVKDEYGVSPGRRPLGDDAHAPVSALPLARLDALNGDDARRYAKKRDVEWPTTHKARERLRDRVLAAMSHQETVVIDAPTALGKTFTVATEPWLNRVNVTGESPVVHLSETRAARDDAASTSQNAGTTAVLKGRKERCPVARGVHDPTNDEEEDDPNMIVTIGGTPASAWFDAVCDGRGVPFSTAHAYLAEHHGQQHEDLPCYDDSAECPAFTQWDGVPRDEDGGPAVDIVHATHQFAYVPSLIRNCNVVFDERPDFTVDMSNDRVRRAVAAYLKETSAPVQT